MKIIHILHHLPLYQHANYENLRVARDKIAGHYLEVNTPPFYVGFWDDYHVKTARKLQEVDSSLIQEVWRPYGYGIKREYSNFIDGILHRVFPATERPVFFGPGSIWSKEIFVALQSEIEKGDMIIHFHDGHSTFVAKLINRIMAKKIPIVYQQRSNKFAIEHYKEVNKLGKLNYRLLLKYLLQKSALRNIDLYLTDSKDEEQFLHNLEYDRVKRFKVGIDFSNFNFDQSVRNYLRKSLGFSDKNYVVLFVGRLNLDKDAMFMIGVFNKIKKINPNIALLIVGAYEDDEFYRDAIDSGAIVINRIPETELGKYYSTADLYLLPSVNSTTTLYGGIGNAPIQAMACGLPVVSRNLRHFMGSEEELKIIGNSFLDKDDLITKIIEHIHKQDRDVRRREIAQKYYDIDVNIRQLLEEYKKLYCKYYAS